jgi:hypothetical protein
MSLRAEIFEWSNRQPAWRQDLIRRLAHASTLDESAAALPRRSFGIASSSSPARVCQGRDR